MAKHLSIQEVEEYLRCPLFYRYRRELGFHYDGIVYEEMFAEIAKRSISAWFNALGRGLDQKKARAKIGHTLSNYWKANNGDTDLYPLIHASIIEIIEQVGKVFNQKQDVPIGGKTDICVTVDGVIFKDEIDAIFIKNGQSKHKMKHKYMVVQVVPDGTPRSPLVVNMRKAMIRYFINSAIKPNPHEIRYVMLTLPGCKKSIHRLEKYSYDKFIHLAKAVSAHINNKMYIPTYNRDECKKCQYQRVCSPKFCAPELSPQLIGWAKRHHADAP